MGGLHVPIRGRGPRRRRLEIGYLVWITKPGILECDARGKCWLLGKTRGGSTVNTSFSRPPENIKSKLKKWSKHVDLYELNWLRSAECFGRKQIFRTMPHPSQSWSKERLELKDEISWTFLPHTKKEEKWTTSSEKAEARKKLCIFFSFFSF